MRRLIFGATAIVTGLAAALGIVVRRRRAQRDDVLPLDPAPPLGSHAAAAHEPPAAPSIEADFGSVDDPSSNGADQPGGATRKPRTPRKPSTTKRGPTSKARVAATTTDATEQAAKPAARPKRPTRVRTSPAATASAESVEPTTGDGPPAADGS